MGYQEKLKEIKAASGLSQQTLAGKLGVSFVTLNSWINGKSKPTKSGAQTKIDLLHIDYVGHFEVDIKRLKRLKEQAAKHRLTAKQLVKNKNLLDRITLNLTYHTNTIEGSTMTKNDVEKVVFRDETLKNRTQIEQREAVNHRVTLDFLIDELAANQRLVFTPDLIKRAHLLLMNGILSNAGEYRNHGVRIAGSHVPLANFIKIPELIEKLCNELNEETSDCISVLARTHARFEQIHPFSDGNGRTGRLLIFIKSLQFGLLPPIIEKERKLVYYKYLEVAQTQEKYDLLEQLIAETIISTSQQLRD